MSLDFLWVLKLKALMFRLEWEEASRFHSYIKNERIDKKSAYLDDLIPFFEELEPTDDVKFFYNSHVKQTLQDSYQMVYLNKLLDVKNYFSIYQLK